MKNIILLTALFIISQYAMGEIVQPSEEMLDSDLNFKHSEEKKFDREHGQQESTQRDVASDKEKKQALEEKVQFWEY